MTVYHTSKQNIAKLRGLIKAARALNTLKASTNNAILKSSIENIAVLADEADSALDVLELNLSDLPSFVIKE